jgi:hypothetical protein
MRRSGRNSVAAIVVFAIVAVAGLAATERIPVLTRAWGALASRVSDWVSTLRAPWLQATDASPQGGDAGVSVRRQTGPLSSAQLGAPLVHGPFISACGATDDMKVVVTLAVKRGRATEVTVKSLPPNPVVESCVERATRDLRWDVSPHTGHVTVTY